MALIRSIDYPVGASGGSLFGVSDGDVKVGVGPRTTKLTFQKIYCWIGGGYLVLSRSLEYPSMCH